MDCYVIVESLFDDVCGVGESVFLVMVYNILCVFCDVGFMQEIIVDGFKSYFDINIFDYLYFFWEDDCVLIDVFVEQFKIV